MEAQKPRLDRQRLNRYIKEVQLEGLPPIFGKLGLTELPDMDFVYEKLDINPSSLADGDRSLANDVSRALICVSGVDVKNGHRDYELTGMCWEMLGAAHVRGRKFLVNALRALDGMIEQDPMLFEDQLRKTHLVMVHGNKK